MTECTNFIKGYREYKKFRNTAEGKEYLEHASKQIDDDCTFPAFDEEFVNHMQQKEKQGLVEPRVYFDTICPNCGKQNPFCLPDQIAVILVGIMSKCKCTCGHIYPMGEHIKKEPQKPQASAIKDFAEAALAITLFLSGFMALAYIADLITKNYVGWSKAFTNMGIILGTPILILISIYLYRKITKR